MGLGPVIASAILMFASTNIDDALVLVVFFANAAEGKRGFQPRHVWIGQFVGFTVIMILSLTGAIAGSFLPPHYAGLLGFVPLLMGLQRTRHWWKKDKGTESADKEFQLPEVDIALSSSTASDTRRKSTAEVGNRLHKSITKEEERLNSTAEGKKSMRWSAVISTHSLKMAAVTLANGGDNVAVYIPVLLTYNAGEVLLTVAVFYVLLAAWLYVAAAFVSFRLVAELIEKYGDYIVPVALILLGVYILWSTDVSSLVMIK